MELDMMEVEKTTARPLNIQAICRLCLSDRKDSLKSIYDEILGPNRLPQKIQLLMQIQISKTDKLSTMICNDCIIRLDTWFAYKKQCHRNQTKLAEWLNITKQVLPSSEQALMELNENIDTTVHVKQETPETPTFGGLLPVKVELSLDDQDFGDVSGYSQSENEHLYLDDLDISTMETDDDRRCPECGKMFGNAQNRRRHQNMLHAKKERRAQMAEIRKPFVASKSQTLMTRQSQGSSEHLEKNLKQEDTVNEPMEVEGSSQSTSDSGVNSSDTTEEKQSTENAEVTTSASDSNKTISNELSENNSNELAEATEETNKMDTIDQEDKVPETQIESNDKNPASTDTPFKDNEEQTSNKEEQSDNNINRTEENSNEKQPEMSPEEVQEDQQKILFAAGLKLRQKDSTQVETESLSKTELSYIEKCKAMVSMYHTLQCACHNIQHKTLRNLLSHLRETRIWFPLFTCYNCMISLTDRSTFTRHHSKCPRPQLETLKKLSNLKKRSVIKSRLYQNFKCNRCKFLYSFHEDFCKHINDDHVHGEPPYYCSCRYVFDSLEEYKTHTYTSCVLSYYCDICFITTNTIEEFVKHAEEMHDNSEGFLLLQENSYTPRSGAFKHKEADDLSNIIEGKRERRKSSREPVVVQIYDNEVPRDLKEIPTKVIREMIQLDKVTPSGENWNKQPASCPLCKKQYSSVNNMVRHYRSHIERREVELPKIGGDEGNVNEDLYSCPDCGGMFPSSKWQKHLEEHHLSKSCNDCDKTFQFQSELDQHRSVHLNLKVYRDSKTHAYKSEMLSPSEDELVLMCEICEIMFESKEELKTHKLEEHEIGDCIVDDEVEDVPPLLREEYSEYLENQADKKPFCDICNKQFANTKTFKEHAINKHGSDYVKPGMSEYPKQCDQCDKMCVSGAGFAQHMSMHDRINNPNKTRGEYPKQCEYCDKICSTPAGYHLHTQMHERVTLGDIKRKKDDKKKIDLIKTEDEEESYHTCKRCFKVFGTKGKLKEHMKSHGITSKGSNKKQRKVLCDLCHVAVEDQAALEKHKSEEHADEMPILRNEMDNDETSQDEKKSGIIYACDICEITFISKPELRAHKESHLVKPKTRNLTCKYCKISFTYTNELTKHMHLEHSETAKPKVTKDTKPFKCGICKKGFASHGAMTTHSGWHKRGYKNDTEVYENTPQGTAAAKLAKKEKVLKKIASAVAKEESSDYEAPEFQCQNCLMELPNETALQIHILENHGDLDETMLIPRCHTCNKDFSTQEEYDTHKRFHDFLERQKKHDLEMLEQQQIQTPIISNVQSVVESPRASPNNLKRYPCNWCSSIFSRQDTLNTHIKQRHNEHVRTTFECPECNRVFDKQNALTIHLKMHAKQKMITVAAPSRNTTPVSSGGAKVYRCSLCNMSFKFPKDLRMHTINAHPF